MDEELDRVIHAESLKRACRGDPEEYWKMRYEMEAKDLEKAADNHRNQLWQITAVAVILIGFAFTLGLAL